MSGTPAVRLSLLGGVSLRVDGTRVRELPHGAQRFVAYLGLADRSARSVVAGQLWPDVPEERAQHRLRTTLWRVQKVAPMLVESAGYALSLGAAVQTDVREVTAFSRRVLDPSRPADDFIDRSPEFGELLPGWYDDWVLVERERLRQLRLHVCEAMCEKLIHVGRYAEAIDAAHTAIRLAPLRESSYRALIGALAAEGNLGEAVRAFDQFADRLADELGLSPSVQLESYVHRLTDERSVRRTPPALNKR